MYVQLQNCSCLYECVYGLDSEMLNLFTLFELLSLSKHQDRQKRLQGERRLSFAGDPFWDLPCKAISSFAYCWMLYQLSLCSTPWRKLEVEIYCSIPNLRCKTMSPSPSSLFLIDCRSKSVWYREQLMLFLAGFVSSGGSASSLSKLSGMLV